MHLHPSTVSGIADRLEGKGLVKRVRHGRNHRVAHLEITRRGLALVRRVPRPARPRLLDALADVPDQRLRSYARVVADLADTMEEDE